MASEISSNHLIKFDGTNYQVWKFQMRALLVANDVYKIVTGETPKPADVTTADGQKWIKNNAKAMCILSSAMTPVQLENCITSETANEMWKKMILIHEHKSATNKSTLLQKFYACRMEANEPIVQFVTKILNMARNLEDLDEKISNAAIIAKILGSLPSKYNNLVTAWDSVDADKQTIDNLQERLIKEERRLNDQDEETSAFIVANGFRGTRSEKPGTNKSQHKGREDRKTSEVTCYYCKRPGHYARNCYKRKFKSKGKQTAESREENKYTGALVTTFECEHASTNDVTDRVIRQFMKMDTSEIWITDSGASCHMTYHREWFHTFSPVNGASVVLGNDETCTIQGSGTILIQRYVNAQWISGRIENVLYVPNLRKNLFSVGVCTSKGFSVLFEDRMVKISHNDTLIAQGAKQGNEIYRMLIEVVVCQEVNVSLQ